MRRASWIGLFFGLLLASVTIAQVKYFPPDFPPNWYEGDLKALNEPSLWESSKTQKAQSFRFLWLRSFQHPLAIRIIVRSDGTSLLIRKMTSGVTGHPGRLIQNRTLIVNREQTSRFLEQVERSNFWKLPPVLEDRGVDGSQWIIEGIRHGGYHVVDRWSPKDDEIHALGLYIARDLARINLARSEIY
jgi:hypothetical protein